MKERLGSFRILERIDEGGFTVVYRAVQELEHGLERPAAVKILQTKGLSEEEQIERLRREVGPLVALSGAPHVVGVLGFGVDEEEGAWIAMELGGPSLKHFLTDRPADPEEVRVLLRDALLALRVCHEHEPPILHRDLKPNNILRSPAGVWQIADFGLAKFADEEDTLELATVKYAAPEMLDGRLGPESPRTDLYSLGMIAYEYALGQDLFRAQFPSVYDPDGGDGGDERPKWMYFHTSREMEAPALADVIEGFPADLSDLVKAMTAKDPEKRPASAAEALERLGTVVAAAPASHRIAAEEPEPRALDPKRLALFGGIGVLLCALAVAAAFFLQSSSRPVVHLEQEVFRAAAPAVPIRGIVERFPEGGSAEVRLRDNTTWPIKVDSEGRFSGDVRVPMPGETVVELRVYDDVDRLVASRLVTVERLRPEKVSLRLATEPAVANAKVTLRPEGGEETVTATDPEGVAVVEVPVGRLGLRVEHARYEPFEASIDSGVDPEKLVRVPMVELPRGLIDEKRAELLGEVEAALAQAASGEEVSPDTIARLKESLAELRPEDEKGRSVFARLSGALDAAEAGGLDGAALGRARRALRSLASGEEESGAEEEGRPVSRAGRLAGEIVRLAEEAALGDPAAAAALRARQAELRAIAERSLDGPGEKRAALVEEMERLAPPAAAGDERALARLGEIREELEALAEDPGERTESSERRTAARRMEELAARAAAGDEQAARELAEWAREEASRPTAAASPTAARRRALLEEMRDVARRAAEGDPAAVVRLGEIREELERLEADEPSLPVEARRAALVQEIDALAERVAEGDPEAARRVAEARRELAALDEAVADPSVRTRTEAVGRVAALAARAANGDAEAAAALAKESERLAEAEARALEDASTADRTARRAALVEEAKRLSLLAAQGDEEAAGRLRRVGSELAASAGEQDELLEGATDPVSRRKRALAGEIARLAARAAAGDPEAAARLAEAHEELARLENEGLASSKRGVARRVLADELASLAEEVASGDPGALARTKEIAGDLEALAETDPSSATAERAAGRAERRARRRRLEAEMADLAAAAAQGDEEARARLAEVAGELAALAEEEAADVEGPGGAERAQKARRIAELAAAAASGDPAAVAALAEVEADLERFDRSFDPAVAGTAESPAAADGEVARLVRQAAQGDPAALRRLAEVQSAGAFADAAQAASLQARAAIGEDASRLAAAVEAAATGDAAAAREVVELAEKVARTEAELAAEDPQVRRGRILQALEEASAEAAATGDATAAERAGRLARELESLEEGAEPATRRARLAREIEETAPLAAQGDPEAKRRLEDLRTEWKALDRAERAVSPARRREALAAELEGLADAVAAGDPAALARAQAIRDELDRIAEEEAARDPAVGRERAAAALAETAQAAAAGDAEAAARLPGLAGDLVRAEEALALAGPGAVRRAALARAGEALDRARSAGTPEALAEAAEVLDETGRTLGALENPAHVTKEARRAALARALSQAVAAAASGDPDALGRVAELGAELAALEEEGATSSGGSTTAERRRRLVGELAAAAGRARSGDPEALGRIAQIQAELDGLEEDAPGDALAARRADLVSELGTVARLAAAGDVEALDRVQAIQRELSALSAIEVTAEVARPVDLGVAAGAEPMLDLVDRRTLLGLTPSQFRAFVHLNVPSETLEAETVPNRQKVRLRGIVFDEDEADLLRHRLGPAADRIEFELRIDPWEVCRRFEQALRRAGARGVRCHAHVMPGDHRLIVQWRSSGGLGEEDVRRIARRFVLDPDLLLLQAER